MYMYMYMYTFIQRSSERCAVLLAQKEKTKMNGKQSVRRTWIRRGGGHHVGAVIRCDPDYDTSTIDDPA